MRSVRQHILQFALLVCLCISSSAEPRLPGKYSGVAVFDRWDGCILYRGIYLTYVSEKTKEVLRPHEGQAIQIDAKEVNQPMNPGDGLIGNFEYLGAAPKVREWIPVDGLQLKCQVIVGSNDQPVARIVITNTGGMPINVHSEELAPTLLTKKQGTNSTFADVVTVSDGPSYALITRASLRTKSSGGITTGGAYSWALGDAGGLPGTFTLEPHSQRIVEIYLTVPDGEYDFLCGYASLTSPLSGFDVRSGKVTLVARPKSLK